MNDPAQKPTSAVTQILKTICDSLKGSQLGTTERAVAWGDPARQAGDPEQWRNRRRVNLQQVLVPVDFTTSSLKALEYARALSTSFGSALCLLHVVESPSFMAGVDDVPLWKSEQEVSSEARAWLEELAQRQLGPAVSVDIQIVSGHAASEIISVARASRSGLIVLTTHGLQGWRHLFRGSTAHSVLCTAPCPVLLLHCPEPAELEREPDGDVPEQRSSNEAPHTAA